MLQYGITGAFNLLLEMKANELVPVSFNMLLLLK